MTSYLAGCTSLHDKIFEGIGTSIGRQVGDNLPPPVVNVKPQDPWVSWCQIMQGQGWPNIGIAQMDLGPSAQRPVLVILRDGSKHCGWKPT